MGEYGLEHPAAEDFPLSPANAGVVSAMTVKPMPTVAKIVRVGLMVAPDSRGTMPPGRILLPIATPRSKIR
jgi:hypothetical protein